MRKFLFDILVPWLVVVILWLIGFSTRKTRINWHVLEILNRSNQPCILAVWHNNLVYLTYILGPFHLAGVVSRSRDGEQIARVLHAFGFSTIRGSSNAGALAVVRESIRTLQNGTSLAITPDGPRGPRYVVQPGLIAAARLTGAPIVPICFSTPDPWEFSSWDRMKLPRPFSRIVLYVGAPISIGRDADPEAARLLVEHALRRHSVEAERISGGTLPDREPLLAEIGDVPTPPGV